MVFVGTTNQSITFNCLIAAMGETTRIYANGTNCQETRVGFFNNSFKCYLFLKQYIIEPIWLCPARSDGLNPQCQVLMVFGRSQSSSSSIMQIRRVLSAQIKNLFFNLFVTGEGSTMIFFTYFSPVHCVFHKIITSYADIPPNGSLYSSAEEEK